MMNENYTLSDIAVATGNRNNGGNGNGMFGGDGAWWIIILLLFVWGGRGFGGGFGGGGGGSGCGSPCATQADVRAAVDQQTYGHWFLSYKFLFDSKCKYHIFCYQCLMAD